MTLTEKVMYEKGAQMIRNGADAITIEAHCGEKMLCNAKNFRFGFTAMVWRAVNWGAEHEIVDVREGDEIWGRC